jgi:hypothetical protein
MVSVTARYLEEQLARHYASVDLTHINMLTDLYMSMVSGVCSCVMCDVNDAAEHVVVGLAVLASALT